MNEFKANARSRESESELAYRAGPIVEALRGSLPDHDMLKAIVQTHGPGLATMVLYRAILSHPLHGDFIRFVQASRGNPQESMNRTDAGAGVRGERRTDTTVLVVPGGEDLFGLNWDSHVPLIRGLARQCGYRTDEVTTSGRNSFSQNARSILEALKAPDFRDVIIFSYGRGTADVRFLLQRRPQTPELAKVRVWINWQGPMGGSQAASLWLSDWRSKWQARLNCWRSGGSYSALMMLRKEFGFWNEPLELPGGMVAVSLVGMPLRGHLPRQKLRDYDLLVQSKRHFGPNDGQSLLLDQISDLGFIYPVWGASNINQPHYFNEPIRRILNALKTTAEMEKNLQSIRSQQLRDQNIELAGLQMDESNKDESKMDDWEMDRTQVSSVEPVSSSETPLGEKKPGAELDAISDDGILQPIIWELPVQEISEHEGSDDSGVGLDDKARRLDT